MAMIYHRKGERREKRNAAAKNHKLLAGQGEPMPLKTAGAWLFVLTFGAIRPENYGEGYSRR